MDEIILRKLWTTKHGYWSFNNHYIFKLVIEGADKATAYAYNFVDKKVITLNYNKLDIDIMLEAAKECGYSDKNTFIQYKKDVNDRF